MTPRAHCRRPEVSWGIEPTVCWKVMLGKWVVVGVVEVEAPAGRPMATALDEAFSPAFH